MNATKYFCFNLRMHRTNVTKYFVLLYRLLGCSERTSLKICLNPRLWEDAANERHQIFLLNPRPWGCSERISPNNLFRSLGCGNAANKYHQMFFVKTLNCCDAENESHQILYVRLNPRLRGCCEQVTPNIFVLTLGCGDTANKSHQKLLFKPWAVVMLWTNATIFLLFNFFQLV